MHELPVETFTGAGVVIRPPREEDLPDLVAAVDDPVIRRFTMPLAPDPFTGAHARAWLEQAVPAGTAAGEAHLIVAEPDGDRLIGAVAVTGRRDGGHTATLDWWTASWARGRGVSVSATSAVAAWALRHGIGRLEMLADPANAKGQRVAAAAGFTHEGVRRAAGPAADGTWRDLVVWSRLSGDSGDPAARSLPDLPPGGLTDGVVTVDAVRASDADAMYTLMALPDVIATTVAPAPPTPEAVARRCAEAGYRWLIGARADCAIRDAATGEFAGDIGLMPEPPTRSAMVGYSVVPRFRGRGYAGRAVRLLTAWAFDVAGFERLSAGAAPDNSASRRTLEHAGFREEGYEHSRLPAPPGATARVDNILYALLRNTTH